MQKSFTQLFWTYQNYFSNHDSKLVDLNFFFDIDTWFEKKISEYEKSLPEIKESMVEEILKKALN